MNNDVLISKIKFHDTKLNKKSHKKVEITDDMVRRAFNMAKQIKKKEQNNERTKKND